MDYADIFYHHRPDCDTPIEESMAALDYAVRSGRALYVGLSNYRAEQAEVAIKELKRLGTPCLVHQPRYNMLERWVEDGLLDVLEENGVSCIPFCHLSQGLLTNRYLHQIPSDSRIAKGSPFLKSETITDELRSKLIRLNEIAAAREQNIAQLALAWVLRHPTVTSALIGCSKLSQIEDNLHTLENRSFLTEEETSIDKILAGKKEPS